jgi:DASS family divalent anion:Na+ symporter
MHGFLQVSLMYPAFLAVAVACGAPPYPAALSLAMASHLMSSLTHYSSGNSPVFFNLGYCDMKTWWTAGLVTSLAHGAVWVVVGGAWWRVLGYWDTPAGAAFGA